MCLLSEMIHTESPEQCLVRSKHSFTTVCYYSLCHTFISRKCLETWLKGMYFYHNCSTEMHTSHFFFSQYFSSADNKRRRNVTHQNRAACPSHSRLVLFCCWSRQGCFIETCSAVDHFPLLTDLLGGNLLGRTCWHFTTQQPNPGGHRDAEVWLPRLVLMETLLLRSAMFLGM